MSRIFIFGMCMLLATTSQAADDTSPPYGQTGHAQVWINAGMLSRHFDRSTGYRENNYGFGAEVAISPVNSIAAGYFKNSDNLQSNYVAWMWKPWSLGPVKFGLVAGAFDGYQRVNHGRPFPAVFPLASLEYRSVGLNMTIVPNYGDRLHGAVVGQLKLRVW